MRWEEAGWGVGVGLVEVGLVAVELRLVGCFVLVVVCCL